MSSASNDSPNVRFPPPLLYLAGFLAGVALHRWVGHDSIPAHLRGLASSLGIALIAAGLALIAWAVATFRRLRTTLLPMRPSFALAAQGPYRFTRNPMYGGLAAIYFGAALMAGFAWPLACLPVVLFAVRRLIIDREERYLDRRFGDAYRAYTKQVRRWL